MANIVFRYEEMKKAVDEIKTIAGQYKTAATTLESDFRAAITNWEGDSKDAMQGFISNAVMEYTRDTVPQILEALAELLNANIEQMQNADAKIAENIPTTLGE